MKINRYLYLAYYLKQLDKRKFNCFFDFVYQQKEKNKISLLADVLRASILHNISLLDYFYFRFYDKSENERAQYAGTGYMYEYQLEMNPPKSRPVLEDKILFNKTYSAFVRRMTYSLEELEVEEVARKLLVNPSGKIVLKAAKGQVGAEVEVFPCEQFLPSDLSRFMKERGFDLAEEYVQQHPSINALSPSGLNTIRIFSQLDENGDFHCLGARLRISVNSPVDNMAAGNLAAPIDEQSGIVNGSAVYSDITKHAVDSHPVTHQKIVGFQIPFWSETMRMLEEAAKVFPQNRSIGWDVAITEAGPELIEGNHNWCKLLWQLPVQKGLKKELEKFL